MREYSAEHAKACLQEFGMTVIDIDVAQNANRADLLATYHDEHYLVEAKRREEHEDWLSLLHQAHKNGLGTLTRDVKPWNALSSMIEKAYKQLLATPAPSNSFRILWIVAPHDDSSFVLECTKMRLYGLESLVTVRNTKTMPSVEDCYFYYPSEFERMPCLEAVVLTTDYAGKLLLNPLSSSTTRFKKSHLYLKLRQANAVVDPYEIHEQRKCFLIPPEKRKQSPNHSNWAYIKEEYGVMTCAMKQSAFNGLICVNNSE